MKVNSNSVYDILLRMRVYFQGYSPAQKYVHEDPLRSELFSSEQMEQQGKVVAASHRLMTGKAPAQLIKRLSDNEKVLIEVRNLLVDTAKANKRIPPAGEWVLDNFYLVEEHIVIGKRHLPKGYSQSLPWLANGASAGLPRVYDIALDIISHSDGRIDMRSLTGYVAAYQTVTKLTIGELWAIPIMLRLALIENLRRVAARIAMDKIDQELADYWAGLLINSAEKDARNMILVIADMARSSPPLASPFVAEMTRQLQGKGPVLSLPLTWMEQQLSEAGQSSNELVHVENQKQAADQVSISNSIGSLRFLGSTDWRNFVETLSSIDEALAEDMDGLYTRMDFSTRDHYRHVIEAVAHKSKLSEQHVARTAVALAKDAAKEPGNTGRTTHVGYYLIDKGLVQLEQTVNTRFTPIEKMQRAAAKHPLAFYVWPIILIALMFSAYATMLAYKYGMYDWLLPFICLLTFISSTHLAVSIVNWIVTLLVKPQLLPRMDFSKGIPAPLRTLVVIPTMLSGRKDIADLVEALEVRYLANSDAHLHFALLTDFADASQENMPGDDSLLAIATEAIEALNRNYKRSDTDIFFLFHRPRRWNDRDRVWMGYERKRGKLSELNELLRGGAEGRFSHIVGDYSILLGIRYIITLDTDTQLPRDAAWKFVATMAHPLNHAVYNEQKQRVTEGYGILQPRVAVSLPTADNSLYARMHQNDSGLDPYTRVTSDVYQDMFGEGSFIGKGIYDVDVFEKALNNRFPENRILSHDLLEGCYTRCGLISDVQLYEEYPSTYRADVSRRHRWVRGDWQIAWWMLPWIPDKNRRLVPNRLSWLARWKIFDNIRRSLAPIALVTLLLLGWTVLPMPWVWTLLVTGMMLLQTVMTAIWHVVHKPNDLILKEHILEAVQSAFSSLLHVVFAIACLPYEAYYNTNAIVRTSWRMMVTNRGLLEWTPSGSQKVSAQKPLAATYRTMWVAPFLTIVLLAYLCSYDPMTVIVALPILLLWAASPAISWYISLPLKHKVADLNAEQRIYLQKLARKTWAFFDHFVGAEDNWLPPDNYQENPVEAIAHRTSPTNIGLSMLSALTAYDFGYISGKTFLQRTTNAIDSIGKLEKYNGHLYNWYDTKTLQPLFPRYVSTVDSGNFAGHLITLRQGLFEVLFGRVINRRLFEGISDTLYIVADTLKTKQDELQKMRIDLDIMRTHLPATLRGVKVALDDLAAHILPVYNEQVRTADEGSEWVRKLYAQVQDVIADINELAPWLTVDMPVGFTFIELDNPTLATLANAETTLLPFLDEIDAGDNTALKAWAKEIRADVVAGSHKAAERVAAIEELGRQCMDIADMEYEFLYDRPKKLYRIGYNVEEHRNDPSYYDLLASEARLCVFVAIAQGKMEQESWFSLGRLLTNAGGGDPILLSWSGSMFEYLMPLLVMPTYDNTLLDQTNKSSVARQIEYGKQRGVPWGISESGYNTVDANLNYQYRAFGVPGLGLKRGLGDDLVIAPYATMLALMVAPEEACRNLQHLTREGFEGNYGFFEAIDYTAQRLPRGQSYAVIRSYMAHHQGMSLLSLSYLLLDKPMQRRFEAEPQVQATLLLLQERLPRATIFYSHTSDIVDTHAEVSEPQMRIMGTPNTPVPEVHLLSNSRYQVVITNAGGGYSCWKDIAVTRWREDTTRDNWGMFCYIKDTESGEYWSNTYQPTLKPYKSYEAVFSMGHAEFRRRDAGIETYTEIVVSPEDDIEMRRLRITNRTAVRRVIEITSYAEVVLATSAADMAHPTFSNLFVQTEIVANNPAIICTRRKRNENETPPWMFHLMTVNGAEVEMVSYETDRSKFIGRGNTVANPQVMDNNADLSGSEGSVLDPIVAIRYRIVLKPNQAVTVDMVLGIADTRDICMGLMEKYKDRHLKNRAFELSWTHSHVLLRQINALEADAQLYSRLAGYIIYSNPILRTEAAMINRNNKGQSGLWSYSISGDLPIVLLRVQDTENIEIVKQMVQAHAYWRLKGLYVDLVIWNEDHGSYRQLLQDQILGLITATNGVYNTDRPGAIFVRSVDQVTEEDRVLFQTVARVIINDSDGTLVEQINRRMIVKALPAQLIPSHSYTPDRAQRLALPQLLFFNGHGGFTQDGKEYVIEVNDNKTTPAPWVNVIANADFGTVISESGGAYTWADNAHEYRLTPWNNDPVSDTSGEAYYLRDEETGHYWSPSPAPRGGGQYIIRHGFGYSVFEHIEHGIHTEMWVYVDLEATVKFVVLKIKNLSGRTRKMTATGYVEWVLGDLRAKSMMHIVTEADPVSGVMFSRNRYNTIFADMVAFFDVDDASKRTVTTDRNEFIGRNGTLQDPEAMSRVKLSNRISSGLDPCTALQLPFELYEGQEKEIIFRLGTGKNGEDASRVAQQFKSPSAAAEARTRVHDYWNETLNAIHVETPDEALNLITNGWLTYQTLSSRIVARSGFYQSGGAWGFRDQLQDVIALIHTRPQQARTQILLCASRQFKEGDVQHWWHPPTGRGVRTTCSDDYLWLPYVTSRYVMATGDTGVLDEQVNYLEGRLLNHGEESYYDLPLRSVTADTLYKHCIAAIRNGFKFGAHGLPLMGSGDWNDGMDKVGGEGKGESVWLAFFLYNVLDRFSVVAKAYGDTAFVTECKDEAEKLQINVEKNAWDGEWYRRAYFDDGTPLGSSTNEECRIDSISQSWSVLSGAGEPGHARAAMTAVDKHLVRRDMGIIQLLDPPFDKAGKNPGYIRGYVPGVRENGGQYTHAAIWTIMAFATLGDNEKVWELFSMINPVNHSNDAAKIETYKVEPYVAAADVYAVAPHSGRGGWTWYTGSAGWMYQLIVESVLGIKREAATLTIKPCIPASWDSFKMHYRYGSTYYHIAVQQKGAGENALLVDDKPVPDNIIHLLDDKQDHKIELSIAKKQE